MCAESEGICRYLNNRLDLNSSSKLLSVRRLAEDIEEIEVSNKRKM